VLVGQQPGQRGHGLLRADLGQPLARLGLLELRRLGALENRDQFPLRPGQDFLGVVLRQGGEGQEKANDE
jgi:hypothetical protein